MSSRLAVVRPSVEHHRVFYEHDAERLVRGPVDDPDPAGRLAGGDYSYDYCRALPGEALNIDVIPGQRTRVIRLLPRCQVGVR